MKMYKDGIYREIPAKRISEFKELGFIEVKINEFDDDSPTLDDLKAKADKLGIQYQANISYSKLLQKINAKKEAQ